MSGFRARIRFERTPIPREPPTEHGGGAFLYLHQTQEDLRRKYWRTHLVVMQDVERYQVEGQKVEAEEVVDGNLEEGQGVDEEMKEDDNRRELWIPRAVNNLDWHAVDDNLEEDVAVGNLAVAG